MTARINKRHRHRQCKGKGGHDSYDDARQYARELGHGHHPIRCRWCRRWHISAATTEAR